MGSVEWFTVISGSIYLLIQCWIARGWFTKNNTIVPLEQSPAFSVIISSHNDLDRLVANFDSLLSLDYPHFELIIVLDRCTDGSYEYLSRYKDKHPFLRIIVVNETKIGWAPKKWALTKGIESAQNEFLVFTDSDCLVPVDWLKVLASNWGAQKDLILGLGVYKIRPSLLNSMVQLETFYTAFQFVGMARQGIPYMGLGRNIAYRKSFFERNRGFEQFKSELSGDDDLFVNAFAQTEYLTCIIHPSFTTLSDPPKTWKQWFFQKTRHISASKRYSVPSKLMLALFHGSHMGFYVGFILSLLLGVFSLHFLAFLLGRISLSWLIAIAINKKSRMTNTLLGYPVFDIVFFLYNLGMVPLGIILKPKWKS